MKEVENLSGLSDVELIIEHTKRKKSLITMNVVFGILVGVSVFNYVVGSALVFSFFPVFFLPIIIKHGKTFKATQDEIKKRPLTL
jgi:hypothetical protein